MPSRPARRADARRNYERLLAAAEPVLNAHGVNASLDDIAKAAGVANATLYRHFPTRQDLIEAVYDQQIQALCAAATDLAAAHEPATALLGWLQEIVDHITECRVLGEAFMAAHQGPPDAEPPQVAAWHDALRQAAAPLLTAAQNAGAIRADLGITELMTLTTAIARAGEPAQAGHFLTILFEGLTPRP
ncbi:TetR/AcrR family transcriptional regulator [Spirillospora albida]|uniref:TetR/AcrR family transcriptional regulator n=1 Tax=Spirillospora albida TaxID=58123 RepID=UPI0004C29E84|nr:TetR/AcrR family transcriptional regulator [Spirillospora albida]